MAKTKVKLIRPKVGLRLLATKNSEGLLPVDIEGEDCTIIALEKGNIVLRFDNHEQTVWKFDTTEMSPVDFATLFSKKELQDFQYDFKSIWFAPDGGGGYYSYDSEAAANDYCKRTDEDGPYSLDRSEFDTYGPEMFSLLRAMVNDMQNGVSPNYTLTGFLPRMKEVIEKIKAGTGGDLEKILIQNEIWMGRGPSKK